MPKPRLILVVVVVVVVLITYCIFTGGGSALPPIQERTGEPLNEMKRRRRRWRRNDGLLHCQRVISTKNDVHSTLGCVAAADERERDRVDLL